MPLRLVALATLLAATLIGCSLFGPEPDPIVELRDYIASEVDDQDRATEMLLRVDRLDEVLDRFDEQTRRSSARVRRANADYDTDRETLERSLTDTNEERFDARRDLMAAVLELRDLASPTEWDQISRLQEALFLARFDRRLALGGDDA